MGMCGSIGCQRGRQRHGQRGEVRLAQDWLPAVAWRHRAQECGAPRFVPFAHVSWLKALLVSHQGKRRVTSQREPLRKQGALLKLIPLVLQALGLQEPPRSRTEVAVMCAVGNQLGIRTLLPRRLLAQVEQVDTAPLVWWRGGLWGGLLGKMWLANRGARGGGKAG